MWRRKGAIARLEQHASEWSDETRSNLIEQLGTARIVLLGEASHGTHEFYDQRARLPEQFDWVIHIDGTRAIDPIDGPTERWPQEAPETYPTGV